MAEASALNSVKRSEFLNNCVNSIKTEEVEDALLIEIVKPEPQECAVCVSRSAQCWDASVAKTAAGTRLIDFLCKFTQSELFASGPKHVCKTCHDLINMLEQTEIEYLKLKEAFEAIISKNPLFDNYSHDIVAPVKLELDACFGQSYKDDSEDDEPLAVTKKKRRRKVTPRKKKTEPENKNKRKPRPKKKQMSEEDSISLPEVPVLASEITRDVKKEDSIDGSETSSQLNNGLHTELKLEMDMDGPDNDFADDDDDDDYFPEDLNDLDKKDGDNEPKKRNKPIRKMKAIYPCDQCDSKFTTFKRFERHKERHLGGKPPYICEVCGASYKHKRACDIHIALHQGISDWKCEECNKLFPSKGALQRHNNIHTGKLNYQCDLCGKSFIHTSSFKMHKLSHSGVKPHNCDICGLALMTRSHLKRHKRVHTGEKRHECNLCGKRFSERYNLVAHGKAHEAAGEAPLPPAPRRRLFRCTFCQERFERRYMLERHMSLAHNRTLERTPATPRNTMSKLLKAQAQARGPPAPHPHPHPAPPAPHTPLSAPAPANTPASDITDTKEERSPENCAPSILAHKLQLGGAHGGVSVTTWSGAYVAEFGLRPPPPADYTH